MHCKILIGVISGLLAIGAAEASTPQAATEQQCGIDSHQRAERVFAKVNEQQPWREYQRLGDVPELAPGFGTAAEMWTGHQQNLLIRTDEPGEDFEAYTEYCFDRGGQLIHIAYELRTAWGWSLKTGGPVFNGAIRSESTGFFSTETERPITKPESADDVREALKPTLFLRENRLPFASLLSR